MLEGYNSTIMAYGQTGSGKSFTMQEDPDHIGNVLTETFIVVKIIKEISINQINNIFKKIFHSRHYTTSHCSYVRRKREG